MLQALTPHFHSLQNMYAAMLNNLDENEDQVSQTMLALGTDSRDAAILWLIREVQQ